MEKSAKAMKSKDLRASFLAASTLHHLEKEWLSGRLSKFYRGAAEGYAMNNNGLEGTNKGIKDTATFRELMPLLEFLPRMAEWIGTQSYRRNPENINSIPLAHVPSDLDTKDMTDGHNLWKSKKIFCLVEDHYVSVTRIANNVVPLSLQESQAIYKKYCDSSYKSMDDYNSFQKYVQVISPDRRCNCYEFGRKFKCPHSTCVKIMIDKIHIPPCAKTVPLSCHRKPGRPPMARGRVA